MKIECGTQFRGESRSLRPQNPGSTFCRLSPRVTNDVGQIELVPSPEKVRSVAQPPRGTATIADVVWKRRWCRGEPYVLPLCWWACCSLDAVSFFGAIATVGSAWSYWFCRCRSLLKVPRQNSPMCVDLSGSLQQSLTVVGLLRGVGACHSSTEFRATIFSA